MHFRLVGEGAGSFRKCSFKYAYREKDRASVETNNDILTPSEVRDTRWLLAGVRPIKPILQSVQIGWKFLKWLAGELKWIGIVLIAVSAVFQGDILDVLRSL